MTKVKTRDARSRYPAFGMDDVYHCMIREYAHIPRIIMKIRLFIVLTFLTFFASFPATAQTTSSPHEGKSFDTVMQEAIRLYNEGKTNPSQYEEALDAFLYAHRIQPDEAIVTYNIARTYHHLGNCEKALNHYLLYQSVALADSDYMDVSEYVAALTKQCGLTGSLVLHCAPSHATISLDGERAVPCDGVHTLKAGQHHYIVQADGYTPMEADCQIEINSISTADIELQRTVQSIAPKKRPSLWEEPLFIAGFATTTAGTRAASTGGILMASAYDESRRRRKDGHLYGGTALLTIGSVAVGTGLGLILYHVLKTRHQDEDRVQQYQQKLAFEPVIEWSPERVSAGIHIVF